jgi:regulator of replication initiation timing
MESKEKNIDVKKLNEALEEFGSLQDANTKLKQAIADLKKENTYLRQENETLSAINKNLSAQKKEIDVKIKHCQDQYQSLAKQIKDIQRQYDLVCGLMTMITGSPSVNDSIDTIIDIFQKLKEPGWYLPKNADEMRSLFVRFVMGDYLKSFRCDHCGAKFILNKMPKKTLFGIDNYCPACHEWYAVKPDDSFLKAMVSQQQLENTYHLDKVLDAYETLLPFQAFLNAPCEICHKPVAEWDGYNVKLAVQGTGCGHTSCWKSDLGQMIELKKALEKMNQH